MHDRKRCDPLCEFFLCEQKALSMDQNLVFCKWCEDECQGPSCNYASCTKGKILANGLCGLTIRRGTKDLDEEELETIQGIEVDGKLSKRLGDREIF